jgi:hypothetical protein
MELYLYAMSLKNCRTVCVRKTYRMLKDTVIKTFFEWVPKRVGKYSEADMVFTMPTPLGGTWEILFRSAETPDDIDKFRGLELTNYWLDEAQELPKEVKLVLDGRLSWPAGSDRSIFKSILTTNPCPTDHWIYSMYVKRPLPDHAYWRQSAKENPHIHESYYEELASTYRDDPDMVQRYVNGEWGSVFSGKPVYPEFNRDFHVSPTVLIPLDGVVISRGWDFGRTPAVLLTQLNPNGIWMILREFWSNDSGVDEFADLLVEFCNTEFRGFLFTDVGDPSGRSRSDNDESSCYSILHSKGINAYEASTNALIPRREAMARQLAKNVKGKPKIIVDPRCERFINGMSGGYKFPEKAESGGEKMYSITPEKNKYSHICEAGEYVALDLFGYSEQNSKLFSEPLNCKGVVGV